MIRIKPEQDVTKRKAGVFRVYHLFQSTDFHIILSVCVCVCIVDVSVSPIYFCGGSAFWMILFDKLQEHIIYIYVSMIILHCRCFLHCWKCVT